MNFLTEKIPQFIILAILSIPLDQEIYGYAITFIQSHPAIEKIFHPVKQQAINNQPVRNISNENIKIENASSAVN